MAVKILSACTVGIESSLIEVEIDISSGLSQFIIVGLGDTSIQEAKERVRFAITNCGYHFPRQRKVINLAPANLRKHGSGFDLAIAVGLIIAGLMRRKADGDRPAGGNMLKNSLKNCDFNDVLTFLKETLFLGELSLDGCLKGIRGVLPMVFHAKKMGLKRVVLPKENLKEALLVKGITIVPIDNLTQVMDAIKSRKTINTFKNDNFKKIEHSEVVSNKAFANIKGQEDVKRAMLIAAAGRHNILMCGPPGCGKTMIARAAAELLPPLDFESAIETTAIYSVAGKLKNGKPLIQKPPFCKVHHSASMVSLMGGGSNPMPGLISLAHKGILLLDEIAEFPQFVIESLRQPMEDKEISIHRAKYNTTYPCNFMLIATMNPCPCGYAKSSGRQCKCSPSQIEKYQRKISGPMLDRFDLFVHVKKLTADQMLGNESDSILDSITDVKKIQIKRQGKMNGDLSVKELSRIEIDTESRSFIKTAIDKMNISGRGYHRLLRLSRTIADFESSLAIKIEHIAEALQYRPTYPLIK